MTSAPAALDVADLGIRYGAKVAVDGLSFRAPVGAVTALVGPNGAGKTSTVEACVGLRRFHAGRIDVLGHRVTDDVEPPAQVRDRVGVMLQDGGLYPTARPLELVRHVAALYPSADDPADLLSALGIDPATRTTIRRMSGGEQRRIACAAALVGRPSLAFLDEPTAGLDAVARREFHELIRARVADGLTVVLTTHLMDDVERLADRVVVVARGRALRAGSVPDLVGDEESVAFRGPMHADLVDLRAALPPGATVAEEAPGRFRVSGAANPMVLSVVAAWCAQNGVRTSDLAVGRRTLEDVVIDLVGDL